jgi:hypothetical protein
LEAKKKLTRGWGGRGQTHLERSGSV